MKNKITCMRNRIRTLCMLLALLLVPSIMRAADYYLVGDFNSWATSDTYKFTVSGTTATLKLTGAQIGITSTEFLIKAVENSSNSWYLKNSSTSVTTVTVDGDAVTASSDYNETGGNYSVRGLSTSSSTTYTFTFTADGSDINHSKLKITSSSTGGGTSTTANQPGIYLYGEKFGATSASDHLTYKFLRKNDSEYHFALYAGSMPFALEKYQQGNAKTDNTVPSWNGYTFTIAYIDANGNFSTFRPRDNYTLTGTDPNASTEKSFGSNTQWTIQDNGGMYDLVVKVDADGKPTSWYYESDPNQLVSYKASSTSNWTTEGFLYCKKSADKGATAYNKNFFGTIPMVKGEEFKFITGNYWLGQIYKPTEEQKRNIAIAGADGDAPNLINPYDGIYPIEYNLDRTNYQLAGGDQTPLRIFMIGSALNSNLSNNFTDWDPANAIELVYDADEQCYKGTVSLSKNGQFRFLRDKNASGSATSLELNFGEDSNTPGKGGDTDANNHVAYNSKSTTGTNVVFNPETNTYNVRFYIEAGTDMSSFDWNSAKYRYTIELPARLGISLAPPTATVEYAASLTPKVAVVGTTATKRTYAYTLDGTDPVIDTSTGKTGNKYTTYVATYDYDEVVPTNDIGTFYMAPGNVLKFIDKDGYERTKNNITTVTVKAQAVQTVTEGSKYRLEGNIATGIYTFKTAGEQIQPAGSYTVTVTNNEPVSVNKAVATVEVKKDGVVDPDVDVYYTANGDDPLGETARIVRDRTITIYSKPGKVWNSGTIKVAIPNTKATASCNYDITYSTSEGGYKNYLNNKIGDNVKDIGGDGHVVVYVQPFDEKRVLIQGDNTQVFINAYEKLVDEDGKVSYKSLTTARQPLDMDACIQDANGDNWYYVDLVPTEGYKEINVTLGYIPKDKPAVLTQATVANVCKDMFLRYDLTSGNTRGQITDVTYQHTLGEHFYTTGDGGTKTEPANPASGQAFFYAQVPLAWVSGKNTLKVYNGTSELTGATLVKQNGAETSDYSCVYKIPVPTDLAENTELTLKPNNGTKDGNVSWKIKYQNGGYYFYESASHYSTVAPLVFSQDNDETMDGKDMRINYGFADINKTLLQNSDNTCALNPTWDYSPSLDDQTTEVTDNWTGNKATVNVIPAGTTISQTPVYSFYSESDNSDPDNSELDNSESDNDKKCVPITVQMIVRGEKGAKATLKLQSINPDPEAASTVATDTKTFSGYGSQGTVTTDGRVESLLTTNTKNGWQKLEATLAPTADENGDGLSISLTAEGGALQLSDVTLLENANTDGHVWTKAPTNGSTTEYELSLRSKANAYSFFDRGENKNAIIYANVYTVVGKSENTYNVAAATPKTPSAAKAHRPWRNIEDPTHHGSWSSKEEPTEYTYAGGNLKLTDGDAYSKDKRQDDLNWGVSKSDVSWKTFSYDRKFTGTNHGAGARNTICLPFAMDETLFHSIFGNDAKIYYVSSIENSEAKGTSVTFPTAANTPYVLELSQDKDGIKLSSEVDVKATPTTDISTAIGTDGSKLVGVFKYTNQKATDGIYKYYGYDAMDNGRFKPFDASFGAVFKPFRAYLAVNQSAGAKPFYLFKVDEHPTTSITNTEVEKNLSNDAPVYNLQGQMVRKTGEQTTLPRGIYIQGGKKYIQK